MLIIKYISFIPSKDFTLTKIFKIFFEVFFYTCALFQSLCQQSLVLFKFHSSFFTFKNKILPFFVLNIF